MEVLLERSTHNSSVSVGRERTGQHRDVSEGTFKRLVENIRNFILEILRCDQRVGQVSPALTQHSVNFTTRSTQVLVVVKRFPQGKKRFLAGLGTSIDKNDNLGVQNTTKSVEKPAVRVDLFAVLLLQAENHLDGREVGGFIALGANQLLVGGDRELGGVFELKGIKISIFYQDR